MTMSIFLGGLSKHLAKILNLIFGNKFKGNAFGDNSMHPFLTMIERLLYEKDGDLTSLGTHSNNS